ncbi:hypothetical protein D3C81_2089620 [compost metagenome]
MSLNQLTMKAEYVFSSIDPNRVLSDESKLYMIHRRALVRGDAKAWEIDNEVIAKRTTLAEHYSLEDY